MHSLRMIPPCWIAKTVSMSLVISNSCRLLTLAFSRYLTSVCASLNFSVSLIPEWAKTILLKLTNCPFSSLTLMTAPVFPRSITYPSLSFCSMVRPALVIDFSQVYTPATSLMMLFSSAKSRAISRLVMGPLSGSTSRILEYSNCLTMSS